MNPSAQPAPTVEIEVLLATFNGERFLREQIDSILTQDFPTLRILARDDGSADATPAILAEYAAAHPARLRVLPTTRPTGSAKVNFLELMQAATADYVAFADQDDVWLPTKLSESMTAMASLERRNGPDKPLLVFTDLRVVDEHLQPLHPSLWAHLGTDPTSVHRLARLLGRSVVTGCTMLINRPMLLFARRMPPEAVMHDRWIGLLAASLGASASVAEPTVLYRQHACNVIGATAPDASPSGLRIRAQNNRGRLAERLRSETQAQALLNLHGAAMPPENAHLLELYLRSGRSHSPVARVVLTMAYGFTRGSLLANLALLLDLARSKT